MIDRFPTHRAKLLLAYLALYPVSHSRGLIAELLWPGGNPDAIRFRLNQTVAELRKTLRPFGEIIESDRFTVRLSQDVTSDIGEFNLLLKSANGDTSKIAIAIQMASRPPLNGIYEDWAVSAADHVNQQVIRALDALVVHAMESGQFKAAESYTQRALELDPYNESFLRYLLQSYLRQGKRADAMRSFEDFESKLRDDFAMSPGEETLDLVRGLRGATQSLVSGLGHSPAPRQRRAPLETDGEVKPLESGTIYEVLETYILANDPERAMRLATSLLIFWNLRGELHICRKWMKRIFAMPNAMVAPPDARCAAMIVFGIAVSSMNEFKAAVAAFERALEIAKSINHAKLTADALRVLGNSAARQGDVDASRRFFERSLTVFDEMSDPGGSADSYTGLREAYRFTFRYEEAERAHRKALEIRMRIGREDRAAHSRLNLGIVASRVGDYERAMLDIKGALATLRSRGSPAVVADSLMEIAGCLANLGNPSKAARLLSAVSSLRKSIKAPIPTVDRPDYVRFLSKAHDQMNKVSFAKEWELGKTISLEQIIDQALS